MKTFIVLIKFTPQGIRGIKESPDRADAFAAHLKSAGIRLKGLYWTFGEFDGVLVFDAPDEETAHAAILALAHAGNVQTRTLRAYNQAEMEPLLAKLV
jgi:uncharacterized protein with GYD domain